LTLCVAFAVGAGSPAREVEDVEQEVEPDLGSAKKELEEVSAVLARREGMLSQAESISGMGSWELDTSDDTLQWSDQMFRIYGVDRDTFIPNPPAVRAFYHPDDVDYVRTIMDTALSTKQPFHFEYRIIQPSGDIRILEASGRAQVAESTGALRLFGVVQDVTDRKETEKVLADAFARERVARVAAEKANAELESFVYTVSHDLNSPLISILGYIDLLETDFGASLPKEASFYLERIKVSGKFMQSLITDLLDLSRVGRAQTEPEVVDLKELVDEIADEVVGSEPEAKVIGAEDLPNIYINATRARQLFANLIQNSVKYAGRPDVHVEVKSVASGNGLVTLSVSDNGPGIPENKRDQVFGVFERLDPTRPGTGIGLAVCRRIVETNGGVIWIADSDAGTSVHLSLPAVEGSAD
jgi:PAS domain S-box-containing protein